MNRVKEGVKLAKALRPIDYYGQGAVVLAVDTSYIAVGFYIFQEDAENPKLVYYAKFGSRNLNEREARFSQPKRELFGLKEALRLNKMWLFGARKLIVETDAKYIKGMLDHPDMMPNATINRWITEILMYQFVLRHKVGKTFGPDGLSRRPPQPSDPPLEICSDDERDEEMLGPPEFRVLDPTEPQPLPIEEFVDIIDSRGGYFQGVAKSIHDFQEELTGAVKSVVETKDFILKRAKERRVPAETIKQLVSVLSLLPEAVDDTTEKYYPEEHRSPGAIGQDDLVPHIIEWFRDKSYRPRNFSEKKCKHLLDLTKCLYFIKIGYIVAEKKVSIVYM
jgi:hypothetical protein